MSPDKEPASWSHDRFRLHVLDVLRFLIQKFQTHCSPGKVKIDAEVAQEVTTEDTRLRKSRRLVYRLEVEHRCIDLVQTTQTQTQSRQLQQLHIFRHPRGAKHAHLRRLQQIE